MEYKGFPNAVRVDFSIPGVRLRHKYILNANQRQTKYRIASSRDLHSQESFFFSIAQQHLVGHGILMIEASLTHSDTSHSVGRFWASEQLLH
jgi:hypothetical protein